MTMTLENTLSRFHIRSPNIFHILKSTIYILIISNVFACSSIRKEDTSVERLKDDENADSSLVAFVTVADPQIHNVYGSSLKQMFGVSDVASKVAVRPPELNILAKYSLESLITRSLKIGSKSDMVFVLGDATNVACSGEYESFYQSITNSTANNIWLMAHGNHDSYLMGTTNSYTLHDDIASKQPNDYWPPVVSSNGLPADSSLWNKTEQPAGEMNWRDACLQYSASTPMNKISWMAKYIKHIAKYGVTVESQSKLVHDKYNKYKISSRPNSSIAGRPYLLIGEWFEPTFYKQNGQVRLPSESFLLKPYGSYFVQAYSIDDNTVMVLLDTSVCIHARAGEYFYNENAGTHACIGDSQLEDIKSVIHDPNFSDKDFIFAGHGTLDELSKDEREKLTTLFESAGNSKTWTYISAHTHFPINDREFTSGTEINIGSTTDWPMEAHKFYFDNTSKSITHRHTQYIDETLFNMDLDYTNIKYKNYSKPWFGEFFELCRHLNTAKALMEHNPGDVYESPRPNYQCVEESDWNSQSSLLNQYLQQIEKKMIEPEYRKEMLRIMAVASRDEALSFSIF